MATEEEGEDREPLPRCEYCGGLMISKVCWYCLVVSKEYRDSHLRKPPWGENKGD